MRSWPFRSAVSTSLNGFPIPGVGALNVCGSGRSSQGTKESSAQESMAPHKVKFEAPSAESRLLLLLIPQECNPRKGLTD